MNRLFPLVATLISLSASAAGSDKDLQADKALEDAFGPPTTQTEKPKLDADVPPPQTVQAPTDSPEEAAERELDGRLSAATTDAELVALAKDARRFGPLWALKIAERRVLMKPKDAALATAWLAACGPGNARERARCRDRALTALEVSGGAAVADARRFRTADECVAHAERGGSEDCIAKALAVYKKAKDRLMALRATLARLEQEEVPQRQAALGLCSEPRCGPIRADVLDQASERELAQAGAGQINDVAALKAASGLKHVDAALKLALQAVKLRQATLPASERLYARTTALDAACAAYDLANGKGKCRAQEPKALGGYVLRDFSLKAASGKEGLQPEEARAVVEHYSVLLLPCMKSFGDKTGSGRYTISWMILNDGRVTNVSIVNVDPHGSLLKCVKDQFTRWRYPKYRGEYQHMTQDFRVDAWTR